MGVCVVVVAATVDNDDVNRTFSILFFRLVWYQSLLEFIVRLRTTVFLVHPRAASARSNRK